MTEVHNHGPSEGRMSESLADKWTDAAGKVRWQPRAVIGADTLCRWQNTGIDWLINPSTWWIDEGHEPWSAYWVATLYRSKSRAERVAKRYMNRVSKENAKEAKGFKRTPSD